MPISLSELIAAGDWHPRIDPDGQVSEAVRFVDLDLGLANDLRDLNSRVCLLVGVTRQPATAQLLNAADQLDLVLTALPEQDRRLVHVEDLPRAIDELARVISARPRAALVLASVLRQSTGLPIRDAVAAEAAAYSTLLGGPEFKEWLSTRSARKPVPADEAERLALSLRDGVLDIQLNRKLRLNAIDRAMRGELVEAFTLALADPELRIRLSGAGPCFCNGGDLREFGTTPDTATAWAVRVTQHPGWQLSLIADRTEVFMHGACAGAGIEMAAFANAVAADPATTFLLPELSMGLIPGAGGCVSIPRRIGRWRTLWLVLSATTLTAPQALDWGLIDSIAERA